MAYTNRFRRWCWHQCAYYLVRDHLDNIWENAADDSVVMRLSRRNHSPLIMMSEREYYDMMDTIEDGVELKEEVSALKARLEEILERMTRLR